jgi:hypothetical protein
MTNVMHKFLIYLFILSSMFQGAGGGAVVEAMRYKPEGRGIDSRLSLKFFFDINLPAALWSWGRLSL